MKTPARLYVLLASTAPVGVIFRGGPSAQVCVIKWNLDDDTFEIGQWFKGRIYEHRGDLSPDGKLLLYFAADQRRAASSWTAISRPPFLTALALWPKGNTYGGGGLFASNNEVLLDYVEWEKMELAKGFSIPTWLKVSRLMPRHNWEEFHSSSPWSQRLARGGWELIKIVEKTRDKAIDGTVSNLEPQVTWQKCHPHLPAEYKLRMPILGSGLTGGYAVVGPSATMFMERCDWADWSSSGDLLFAQSGCLYRLRCKDAKFGALEESDQIADFNGLKFQRCVGPEKMCVWPILRPTKKTRT